MAARYRIDLKGQAFGRLMVQDFSHIDKNNGAMWICRCICGKESLVGVSQLRGGHILSCGCLRNEAVAALAKHGMCGTPLYQRWKSLRARCQDINNQTYGAKGITWDSSWDDFNVFYSDMAEGFSEDLELDRIDVTKGYSRDNCRWTTHAENNYNKNKQSNNVTGKTGVSFRKDQNKFRAYITVDKVQIALGVFEIYEEAVSVRREAEIKYYGYYRP